MPLLAVAVSAAADPIDDPADVRTSSTWCDPIAPGCRREIQVTNATVVSGESFTIEVTSMGRRQCASVGDRECVAGIE